MASPLNYSWKPDLRRSTLIIAWTTDAGELGNGVGRYLVSKLGCRPFCEIEPVRFYGLGGVVIESDLVQFPESTFYVSPEKELVVLLSTPPAYEWYQFFNLALDVGQSCHVREVYTIGAMIALGSHTAPRQAWATFSTVQTKNDLTPFNLSREMDFETPPGARPTMNSFVLWTAKRRGVPGANIWVPVPFYLAGVADPKAQRKALELFDDKLRLGLDFEDLDVMTGRQEDQLASLRSQVTEVNDYLTKLEHGIGLTEAEHERLMGEVQDFLRKARR